MKADLQKGFTLVEVMIAVGLFVVVMVAGIGAILSANTSHKKTQSQRTILDSMSFVLEDMSRNLRLGSSYRCPAGVSAAASGSDEYLTGFLLGGTAPSDCGPGSEARSIAFETQTGDPTNDSDQVVYLFYNERLYKSINGGVDYFAMTPPGVKLSDQSGFTVVGAYPYTDPSGTSTTDDVQPRIIIRLSGKIMYKDIETPFDLQTTVSARLIDS